MIVMFKNIFQYVHRSSVKSQLSITVSIGVVVLLLSLVTMSVWVSDRQFREVLLTQNMQVVENLADQSRLALLFLSPENAESAMQSTQAFPEVLSVSIYQSNKKLLTQAGEIQLPDEFELSLLDDLDGPALILETDLQWHFGMAVKLKQIDMDRQLFETEPVDAEKIYGYVYLVSDKTIIHKNRVKLLSSYGLVGGIISLVLLLVLHFFICRLVEPLKELAEAMHKTRHGDYVSKLNADGSREVQYIAETYNLMTAALAERDAVLRRKNLYLEQQASHDPLTGLMNRNGFEQSMNNLLDEVSQDHQHVLCYLDLDKFKIVNDSCGHSAGDELLKQISGVFSESLRKGADTLARIGGDEFAIILRNCTIDKAEFIANNICAAVAAYRFKCSGREFSIGVSIGLTDISNSTGELQDVISRVDRACYVAKERGRGQVHVIQLEDEDIKQLGQDTSLANRILQALDNDGFELFVQSIRPTDHNRRVAKFDEIFLRLSDGEGGWVMPNKIINAARRYNLLKNLDQQILTKSLDSIKRLLKTGVSEKMYAINLSVDTVKDTGFHTYFQSIIMESGVPAELLCFDVTEVDYSQPESISQFVEMVHTLGAKVALDDFVTSATAIGHIRDMKVDYLKIDGYLFSNIKNDPVNCSIIKSITEICRHLNIQSIAEQVEDPESLKLLAELGIDYYQGYIIDQPRMMIDQQGVSQS